MKWLDDVVASVPEDFKPEARELPPGAVTIGALPDDLVPVVRAWVYIKTKIFDAKKEAAWKSAKTLADMLDDPRRDRSAVTKEVKDITRSVEQMEDRADALQAILAVALRERFPEYDDQNIGAEWTPDDGWTVFRAYNDELTLALSALFGLPRL